MKKTVIVAVFAIIAAGLYTGCKKTGTGLKPQDIPPPFQNDFTVGEGANSQGETLYNDGYGVYITPSFGNEGNSDTQVKYLWEEEVANPLIKYVGSKENIPPPPFAVDIDFTTFSGPEFDEYFADVMFLYPNEYLGKTIRFIGQYSGFFDDVENRYKHYVVFDDPKGCCVRYIEFAWNNGYAPNNYPDNSAIVDVSGEFSSYFDKTVEWDFNYLKINGITVLGGGNS